MNDTLETIGQSVIQHGPNSRRVYLIKLAMSDLPSVHAEMEKRARQYGYEKIFAKIPGRALASFVERGYREEARIPGFFRGEEDAVFMGLFRDPARAEDRNIERVEEVLKKARDVPATTPGPLSPYTVRALAPDDIPDLAALYRDVFPTYPFPITEPAYLARTMERQVAYFGVFDDRRLVAASSGEVDEDALAVEMTDFATQPEYRGRGLARTLLARMDEDMQGRGVRTAYTIARAVSPGMNIAFARAGYRFSGTLVNNTGISGSIESMNVWHRHLQPGPGDTQERDRTFALPDRG